jgi:hypothetical protein
VESHPWPPKPLLYGVTYLGEARATEVNGRGFEGPLDLFKLGGSE